MAQLSPKLGNLRSNIDQHCAWIERARAAGAELIIFPELSLTGYILQDLVPDLAIPTSQTAILNPLLELTKDIACIFGYVEVSDNFNFYNSAGYAHQGRISHVHRKLYLPTYGMFDEKRFFAQGESLRTFSGDWGELGILICEDLWHPSTLQLLALEGAAAVIIPSCSPGRGIREDNLFATSEAWENLLRTTAQFQTVYNIYVNRVGFEDGAHFPGGSMIVDPSGLVVARAKYSEEELLLHEIDMEEVRRARLFTPILRDERIELTLRELTRIGVKRNENKL
ncbi:MAG: nitrilase-related carbon-nitrogen hydrolase [Terriglobia bacterium]